MRNRNGSIGLLTLFLAAVLLLGGCQSTSATTDATTVSVQTTAAPTSTPTPTPTPIPTPTPLPIPTPALASDPLADTYFGPLPTPTAYIPLIHNEIRAIFIGPAGNIESNLAVARATEVNAVVVDLKESDGVYYDCNVPLAIEIGAVKSLYSLKDVVAKCDADNVKVIGRIVCFNDPLLTTAKPEYAISDSTGKVLKFSNEGSNSFASPYRSEVWQYYIDIALDAIAAGVDEIQFDYVRFPTGSAKGGTKPYYGAEGTVPAKSAAINRFLQSAKIQIQYEKGIPVGADVFGIILTSKADGNGIGQDWASIGLTGIDSLSPMIYPSHYANSTNNGKGTYLNGILFDKPDLEPYKVMYNVLVLGKESTLQPGFATNRPYLQAFTASYLPEGFYQSYGSEQIKAQIKAITDAGYKEWICWNPSANYYNSSFAAEN